MTLTRDELHRLVDALPDEALPLLRELFMGLLAPSPASVSPRRIAGADIYQLKITLKGVRPPVWRRVLVCGDIRLDVLHEVIQAAMGWMNYHLHQFAIDGLDYGPPEVDDDWGPPVEDEKQFRLDALVAPGDRFGYLYDFGDNWEHRIDVEKILPREPDRRYPAVIKGKGACPPEDSGGPWGYAAMLGILEDPDDEEHAQVAEWLGPDFDPSRFDPTAADEAVARLAAHGATRAKKKR